MILMLQMLNNPKFKFQGVKYKLYGNKLVINNYRIVN